MTTTKQVIADAMKRLLLKKPFNRITISDIADECGISRNTFYYHFNDIYDLMEWMCEEDARVLLNGNRTADTWKQGFVSILKGVAANKPFVVNVYRSVDRMQIERYLRRVTEKLLLDVIEEQAQGLTISEENKRFIANFYTYGFIGVMLEWIHYDMKVPPEQVAEITERIIHGDFRRAIERLAVKL